MVHPNDARSLALRLDQVHGNRRRGLLVGLGLFVFLQREQLLEQPRREAEPERRVLERRKRRRKRRELGVQRVDPGRAPHGLRKIPRRLARQRLHLDRPPVLDDDRRHAQLVEERPDRVRRGERMTLGRRIARHRPDLQRRRLLREPRHRCRGKQVRLPRGRPHPEERADAPRAELAVQLELLLGHVVEPAEVDVVRTRLERSAHDREIQAVVGAVDADSAPVQRMSDGAPRRTRRAAPPPRGVRRAGRPARPTGRGSGRRSARSSRLRRRPRSPSPYFRSARISPAARSPRLDGAVQVALEVDRGVLAGEVAVALRAPARRRRTSCTARPSSTSTSPSSTGSPARSRRVARPFHCLRDPGQHRLDLAEELLRPLLPACPSRSSRRSCRPCSRRGCPDVPGLAARDLPGVLVAGVGERLAVATRASPSGRS